MLDIFQYDFMTRGFAAGVIIGTIAPIIGTFLVVRRYSLMADTLAHVSLVGVAGGILLNFDPIIGALIATIIAAFGMEELRGSKTIFGESVLALFLSGSLAISVILIGLARGLNVNFLGYLFGSISTVSSIDIRMIAGFGIIVVLTLYFLYKEFFLISFDEEMAKANGLPVKALNIVLIVLAAMTVALSMRIVGILLVGALMVIPVITAMQYKQSFRRTLIISVICSLVSVITGIFVSFYFDVASGGTIVVIALLTFILSLLANRT